MGGSSYQVKERARENVAVPTERRNVCATTCVYESVSCFFEVCEICVCVAEVPALWFKKGRCGQMKFTSNEAQIARP